jgi:UDP-N-acetylglucosamine acyltransferase
MIHPTAIVHPRAELAEDVEVGPYSIIGEHVVMDRGVRVGSHACIDGRTHIGEGCRIFSFAVLGEEPQDLKYAGEPSELIIGPHNVFREFVTVHRGTARGGGRTIIQGHSFFMAYCHVAHDCIIGNRVIMANAATLAGHIEIQDHAIIGGLAAIHQFVRIGAFALVSGLTGVPRDVPPYTLAAGSRARLYGLNTVGLRRHGFPSEAVLKLKRAYRILFRSNLTIPKAVQRVRHELSGSPEVENLLDFIAGTRRGICR